MKSEHLDGATVGFALVHLLITIVQMFLIAAGIVVLKTLFGWQYWIAVPLGTLLGLIVMWGHASFWYRSPTNSKIQRMMAKLER